MTFRNPLKDDDISVPPFEENDIPQFSVAEVWKALIGLKTNKSTIPGDLPPKIIKSFAAYLADPLTDILNTSIRRGEYPNIYKYEVSTPVPKVKPTVSTSQLRNISGLMHFDKVIEKLIGNLIISDMAEKLDKCQYGNQKGMSINHYLVKMIHRILTVVDRNSEKEKYAVLLSLIDWNNAFPMS